MGSNPLRVGMIGVGRHARAILLPALALTPELRLVALATAHAETAPSPVLMEQCQRPPATQKVGVREAERAHEER